MNEIPAIVRQDSMTLMHDGKTWTVTRDTHPKFDAIKDALRRGDYDAIPPMLDLQTQVEEGLRDSDVGDDKYDVTVENGVVYYGGEPLHGTVTRRIIEMLRDGFDIGYMKLFLKNLMANPSKRAVDELYDFLEQCNLPITQDGCFLAYKKVNENYRDIHSNTFDNSIGAVCEMPRNRVDEDKNRTCSAGLHFCSQEYLPHFGNGRNSRVVLVKINPEHVVAIPADYNNSKGRTCRYEVVDDVTESVGGVTSFFTPDYADIYYIDGDEDSFGPLDFIDYEDDHEGDEEDDDIGIGIDDIDAEEPVDPRQIAESYKMALQLHLGHIRIKYVTVGNGEVQCYDVIEIRDVTDSTIKTVDDEGRMRTLRLSNILDWDVG